MNESDVMPDLAGFSLASIECPGTEYCCLVFWSLSKDGSRLSTKFVYLYECHVCEADFECDPFFPPTKSVSVYFHRETSQHMLEIAFDVGRLHFAFQELSIHDRSHSVSAPQS